MSHVKWDAALEAAIEKYNREYGIHYDPVEARLQYLEGQEKKWALVNNP